MSVQKAQQYEELYKLVHQFGSALLTCAINWQEEKLPQSIGVCTHFGSCWLTKPFILKLMILGLGLWNFPTMSICIYTHFGSYWLNYALHLQRWYILFWTWESEFAFQRWWATTSHWISFLKVWSCGNQYKIHDK